MTAAITAGGYVRIHMCHGLGKRGIYAENLPRPPTTPPAIAPALTELPPPPPDELVLLDEDEDEVVELDDVVEVVELVEVEVVRGDW